MPKGVLKNAPSGLVNRPAPNVLFIVTVRYAGKDQGRNEVHWSAHVLPASSFGDIPHH